MACARWIEALRRQDGVEVRYRLRLGTEEEYGEVDEKGFGSPKVYATLRVCM